MAGPERGSGRLRERSVGALAFFAGGLILTAFGSVHYPDGDALAVLARIFDSLAPFLLALALLLSSGVALLRAHRLAAVLALLALGVAADIGGRYWQHSLPMVPASDSQVRVLFFNVLSTNFPNADRIADAVLAADPDIAVFAEADRMQALKTRLADRYSWSSDCEFSCGLLVMSKQTPEAVKSWRLPVGRKVARLGFAATNRHAAFTLVTEHVQKPWFQGLVEPYWAALQWVLERTEGPVVVTGDFNTAPWSYPVQRLLRVNGLSAPRWPVPSWPAALGRFGIPIDRMLVGGGARLHDLQAFGGDLGSNHRGVLAEVVIPDAG